MHRSIFNADDATPRFCQWMGEAEGRGAVIAPLPTEGLREVLILTEIRDAEMDGEGLVRLLELARNTLVPTLASRRWHIYAVHEQASERNAPVSAVDAVYDGGAWRIEAIRHPAIVEEEWVLQQVALSGARPRRAQKPATALGEAIQALRKGRPH